MAILKYLFQGLRIGTMEVKNRVVMPAMDPGFGIDEEGCVTSQLIEYFVARARSQPGMIVCGSSAVHPSGIVERVRMVPLWKDKVFASLERMVEAVHAYEVKFGVQLNHCGLACLPQPSVCASEIPELTKMGFEIHQATKEEIREYVEAFAAAAERCIKVGFDFLEIHAAHAYLINEFLTPYYNRRTDEYGGSFENRIRFLLEVVRAVRKSVGKAIPIGVRLNGDDFIGEGGWNLADLCRLAPILEGESVDYLSISMGGAPYGSLYVNIPPMYEEQGAFVRFSEEVRKHVSIPVITVGRIKNPIMADKIIREGRADLVAMGRAQLADPEMVAKARRGEIAEIRLCLGECLGCIEGILRNGEASCTVNPLLGREYLFAEAGRDEKTRARRVLVAGGGCAGLEAARMAAVRGHRVILCEARGWIGGQIRLAAKIPRRAEIADIIPWYERQLSRLKVEIRLNTRVDENLLEEIAPEVLVVATGSLPELPLGFIQGLDNIQGIELLTVDELLEGEIPLGGNVLVLGGDQIGLQVADYLSEMGSVVYLTAQGARFGEKMAYNDRHYLMGRIIRKGVKRYKRVHRIEILPTDSVWLVGENGRENIPQIDALVVADYRRPNAFLAEAAGRKGIEVYLVGDARGCSGKDQGTLLAAIATGYEVGRKI